MGYIHDRAWLSLDGCYENGKLRKQEPLMEHTPTIPKLYVDPFMPGYVRFVNDPTAGFLVGMRAAEVVLVCNAHDELVTALESIKGAISLEFVRKVAGAALAKVQPKQPLDTRQTQGWTSEL